MKDTLILEPSQAGHVAQGRKEFRDEQLFARLIGAAVLLALAVIVLPFVLDGSGSQREYEYAETLPVEPPRVEPPAEVVEKSFSSRQPDSGSAIQAPSPESVSVNLPARSSTVALETAGVANSGATNTGPINNENRQLDSSIDKLANDVATAASGGDIISPQRSAVQGSARATTQAGGAGSGISGNSPIQTGWNIQVASFVRDTNAANLIGRLRAQNLPAYANRVAGSTRTVIRVLVGPFANQIDALDLQNRIDRDYRVESLMVKGK